MHFQTTTILALLSLTPIALSAPSPQPPSSHLTPRATTIQADSGALLNNLYSSRDSIQGIVSQTLANIADFQSQNSGGAVGEAINQNAQQLQEATSKMITAYDALISAAQQATETVGDVDGTVGGAFGRV